MISRNKAKFIKSLQLKKFRKQEGAFIVEGAKNALELINADFKIIMLIATKDFLIENVKKIINPYYEILETTENELSSLGTFQSNGEALVVAKTKPNKLNPISSDEFFLVLDDIRDPGNLGTIIRIADWYGINQIIASETSAELYNPKVLNSSMGSFTRINVYYTDLLSFLKDRTGLTVYGAVLDGENLHQADLKKGGAVLIGNESKGIHSSLLSYVTQSISIPRYGRAESLNAAIATAIICDKLRLQN